MKIFKDYNHRDIQITEEVQKKINSFHPETTEERIKDTLFSPDEVRKSNHKSGSRLYYKKRIYDKGKLRFTSVIVKERSDGHWIESAMTTAKMKKGETIYMKESINEN